MPQLLDRYLGWTSLPKELLEGELEFWRLPDADIAFIKDNFRERYYTSTALLLGSTRLTGSKLERVDLVPKELLAFLAKQFDVKPPRIATLRSLYIHRRTLWEHQSRVLEYLGLRNYSKLEERKLLGFLKESCRHTSSTDRLMGYARHWLHDRKLLIPADSAVRRVAVLAVKETETWLYIEIKKVVPAGKLDDWYKTLLGPCKRNKTVLRWLQTPPGKKIHDSFVEIQEKISFLKSMGIDQVKLPQVPQERMENYFQRLQNYRPFLLKSMEDFNRTIHICCFLKVVLGRANDVLIKMAANTVTDTWSDAQRAIMASQPESINVYRGVIRSFVDIIHGQDLADPAVQKRLKDLADVNSPISTLSRSAEVRERIADGDSRLRPVLKVMLEQDIKAKPGDPLIANIEALRKLYRQKATELPKKRLIVAGIHNEAVNKQSDRTRAMHSFEYAVAADMRRKLRCGEAWIDTSADHRDPDEMLISPNAWGMAAKGHYDRLRLDRDPKKFLQALAKAAEDKVKLVAQMVDEGKIKLSGSGISYPKDDPTPLTGTPLQVKNAINKHLPLVQLPDVLLYVDSRVRFSTALLGRPAKSEHELKLCYAALLALGTDGGAKGIAMMIPGLGEEQVGEMARTLQLDGAASKANQLVLSHYHSLPITEIWGDGTSASADMMSLPTSRHLWNSRMDYRRKTASIGLYDHISNNLAYVYNQPHILGNRQVGAAIHGVVSQVELEITRLAVDTHGYTDVGLGFAKALGFDLCPRIRNLRERRLCLPRGYAVPEGLESVVDCGISLNLIEEHWDNFVRVVASISNATCSAVTVLERFGSGAQGNHTYLAAKHLGRLQRTIFLCDYLTNSEFRGENRRLLTQGENSHKLKRAIHTAQMSHEKGREKDQMIAISAALTLLANIVQYWNAVHLEEAIHKVEVEGLTPSNKVVMSLSPCRFGHINMRGRYEFEMTAYLNLLFPESAREWGAKLRT